MDKTTLTDRGGNRNGMNYVRVTTEGMTDHINLFWKEQIIALVPPPASFEIMQSLSESVSTEAQAPEGFCLDMSHRTYKNLTGQDCSCPKYVRHPDCDRHEIRQGLPVENPWKHPG